MQNIFQYELVLSDVKLTPEQVIRAMGYSKIPPPDYIIPVLPGLINEAGQHLKLKAGIKIIEHDILINSKYIFIGGIRLTTDRNITRHLRGSSAIVIFVITAGEEYDEWIKSYFKKGDHLTGYIIDTIGSEIVESAADWLETNIMEIFSLKKFKCTNRLSPGYCNWDVSDQHELFSLLPKNFCGISLTESALMKPVKSISGIIGVGKNVNKLEYQCSICRMDHCYKRIIKEKHL